MSTEPKAAPAPEKERTFIYLLARGLAERLYRELDIPCYLYEAAALKPERKNLAVCREGEYEALRVLQLRTIYRGIENALDICSTISDLIVNISLKHS